MIERSGARRSDSKRVFASLPADVGPLVRKLEGAWLSPWQEVIGTVDRVETNKKSVVISISSRSHLSLEIPLIEFNEAFVNLGQLTGQRISILRTDKGYVLKPSRYDYNTESKVSRGCD